MNDKTDPVIGLAKLLGILIGAQLADSLAPQLGVAIAAALGGVLGLMRWPPCSRLKAAAYVFACASAGWLFASVLTSILASVHPAASNIAGLPLVSALIIGAVGHNWPDVMMWFFRRGKEKAEREFDK